MTEPSLPPISILICTRDRRAMLAQLLQDLRKQDYPAAVQIVVVEETDAPAPIAGVEYVPHPVRNLGIAHARNLALAHARHDLVVFVDDDCRIPARDWLQRLVAPLVADEHAVAAQGGVCVPSDANAIGWAESLLGFPGGGITRLRQAQGKVQETTEVSTLNAAYRKEAILRAGGLDERARLGGEDFLLARRLAEQGRLLFVPDALVWHAPRGDLRAIWRWFVRRGRAEVALVRQGLAPPGFGSWLVRASFSLKLALALALFPWLSGWPVLLLLGWHASATWRRVGWAWRDAEVPRKAVLVAPLVRLVMDLAADCGRMRAIFADKECS